MFAALGLVASGAFGVPSARSARVRVSRVPLAGIPQHGVPVAATLRSDAQATHAYLIAQYKLVTTLLHEAAAAVPASVRSVRLVLADGRTIESRVVRVPLRNGGPAGVYAQEIRGSTSHAVSLVELNAGGGVVLTVGLSRYRCVKPRKAPKELLTGAELASGRTPEGEHFTISAFGSFNGEPFLRVDAGVDPKLNEITIGLGASKAFRWSLSIGCAPHPYAILYGILVPPGKSVVVRTPQGAVALNVVPVEPRVHAKGPLVYGVFSALSSELTILGANGSTVYTENLEAKATEATQFCEGYAEP